jgi:hypothetical protein
LAHHQHSLVGLEAQAHYAFHASIYRFYEARLLVRDSFGNTDGTVLYDPVHDADIFGKTSATGLETRRAANLLVGFALSEGLVPAVVAGAAGDMVEHHDAVAGSESFDVFARSDYDS